MNPIGVEFSALDPEGLFHHQRLELSPDFRCVKSSTCPQGIANPTAAASDVKSCGQPNRADEPEISMVWIGSGATPAQVRSALEAGKHVLCGIPIVGAFEEWRQLFQQQRDDNSPRVFLAALHRWDSRFRTVQSQINTESLGTVLSLQQISRQFVPGELNQRRDAAGDDRHRLELEAAESQKFEHKWFEFLDELLLLVPQQVGSVAARSTGTGRAAWVTFADGCQVHLELNRRSLAPLETGWIVEGTVAGLASGRRYRAEADSELVDVPIEVLPTDQKVFYHSLVGTIRDGAPFPVTAESILRVLELRAAIEASLRTSGAGEG